MISTHTDAPLSTEWCAHALAGRDNIYNGMKRLSKKQGISDKLQLYFQNPADLKIESATGKKNWKRKSPSSLFFLDLF